MRTLRHLPALFLILTFLFGCSHSITPSFTKSGPQGVYHHVKKGETLWSISRAYNVGIQQIAEANKITNVSQIKENSVLFIPGAAHTIDYTQKAASPDQPPDQVDEELPPDPEEAAKPRIAAKDLVDPEPAPAAPSGGKSEIVSPPANISGKPPVKAEIKTESKPPDKTEGKPPAKVENKPVPTSPAKTAQEITDSDKKKFLLWPVKGSVTSRYGIQPNGMKINGIKILAPDSAPIAAAAAGAVIYSANIKYYGDTVIIKHDENYSTVYCNLKDRTVKVGDIVKKGDKIASVGKPENGDGKSYLHFEVRYRSKPRDPMLYLP